MVNGDLLNQIIQYLGQQNLVKLGSEIYSEIWNLSSAPYIKNQKIS